MKKIFFNFLLLLLSPFLCFSQIASLNTGSIAESHYFESIPYENIKGKIIIPVVIDGITYHFLLDTGAPFAISEKLFDNIKTDSLARIPIADANGVADTVKVISVPELHIGGITFLNTPGVVFTQSSEKMLSCFSVDGIIGSNMLRNAILQINSKDQKIILTNDVSKLSLRKKEAQALTTTISQSNPLIKIDFLNGKEKGKEKLLFDTGADGFYDMSVLAYKVFSKKIINTIAEGEGAFDWGMNGMANNQHQFLINIPELKINRASFKNVIAYTTSDSMSRIGSGILKFGIVTVDYKNKKFYFQPYPNANTAALSERPWPVSFTLRNERLVVGLIWNPTLRKEINPGDEVLQLGGINLEKMNFCTLVLQSPDEEAQSAESRQIILKDVKTGKIKTITLSRM